MRRHRIPYATLLALCAVLLRGVIPLGWMPSAETGSLALCTGAGYVQLSAADARALFGQTSTPAEEHAGPGPCAFAAAATPGAIPATGALPQPPALAGTGEPFYSPPPLPHRPSGTALARAPPALS